MILDFTLTKYQALCESIVSSEYSVWPIKRYVATSEYPDRVILLRHDIDRRIDSALRMARLEHELGLQATYYVRMTRSVFQPAVLEKIAAMGHEIGYHCETLARCHGHIQEARRLFAQELAQLRQICDVATVSMHGSPLSYYDNRDLEQHLDWGALDLLGATHSSLDYQRLYYLTDTGRSWNGKWNLRDRVTQAPSTLHLEKTTDLIAAVRNRSFAHVCIQTHPERWAASPLEWLISAIADLAANQMKCAIASLRENQR
jgi:hypothetical protein